MSAKKPVQPPVTVEEFSELISVSQNPKSGWLNATSICKRFGKRVDNYLVLDTTKDFLKELEIKLPVKSGNLEPKPAKRPTVSAQYPKFISATTGKQGGTWVHPLVAVNLAQWLSSGFAVFVAGVVVRYINADITLADEVADRNNNPEDLEKLAVRAATKASNLRVNASYKRHGLEGNSYWRCADAINLGLFGKTAKQIRSERAVEHTRDSMTLEELGALLFTELAVEKRLDLKSANGTDPVLNVVKQVTQEVKQILGEQYAKPTDPGDELNLDFLGVA